MDNTERADYGSQDGMDVFKKFIEAALEVPPNVCNGSINSAFTVTQVAGKPLYEVAAADGSNPGTASISGQSIVWNPALAANIEYSLTYYVKANSAADASAYYNICSMTFTAEGDTVSFPSVYVNPTTGESKEGAAEEGTTTTETVTDKKTNYLGLISGGAGTALSRQMPEITSTSSNVLKSGRTQVVCEVKNGVEFNYQWQYLDGENWVDIPSAVSSAYTLGKPLKTGQEVQIRCAVSNSKGTTVYSETLKVKVTKSAVSSEGLVSAK